MARIADVNLSRNRRVVVASTYIYGIGEPTTRKACRDTGISEDIRINDLIPEDREKLCSEVDKYRVEGDLRREVSLNTKRLVETGSYRGIRHCHGLPVRGQNIKSNARTRKGSKRK